MSLSFLGKKSFHPSNPKNLKKLFQAEEAKAGEERKAEELKRMWEQEETRRHSRSLLEKGAPVEAPPSTSFMYQMPPGMKEAQEKQKAAAAARRAKAAEASAEAAEASAAGEQQQQTRAERDAERFAILQMAPRQGDYTKDMAVHHRPLGVTIRNVKCTKCGEWGHQMGDRECPLRHELTAKDTENKQRDDPLARAAAGAEASGGQLRWAPKAAPEEGMHGGGSASDANQQFVTTIDEDEAVALAAAAAMPGGGVATMADLDPAVLAMLDERQQRKLLKMYQKEQRREAGGDDGGGDKKRKKRERARALAARVGGRSACRGAML
jgi:CBF1 interacting corepressor